MTASSGFVKFEIAGSETISSQATFSGSMDFKGLFHVPSEPRNIITHTVNVGSESVSIKTVTAVKELAFPETEIFPRASPEVELLSSADSGPLELTESVQSVKLTDCSLSFHVEQKSNLKKIVFPEPASLPLCAPVRRTAAAQHSPAPVPVP